MNIDQIGAADLLASALLFGLSASIIIGLMLTADLIESKRLLCRIVHRWEMVNASGKYEYQQCRRCPKNRIVIQ